MEKRSFESILNRYIPDETSFRRGSMITGEVIARKEEGIILDIGYKCEGIIPQEEVKKVPRLRKAKRGEKIEGIITKRDSATGFYYLSYLLAQQMKHWDYLETCFKNHSPVKGKVMELVKKGYYVDLSWEITAFMPFSHSDIDPDSYQRKWLIGKEIDAYILKFNKNKSILISRKAYLLEEREKRKQELLKTLQEGKIYEGIVKRVSTYGAFVDIGGLEGLVRPRDISWKRGSPFELIKKGEKVKVKVLEFNKEKETLKLGIKQALPDPWENVFKKYKEGDIIKGKVISLTTFGAFIEIEPGVEGLIHKSEISWDLAVKKPADVLKEGDTVEAKIMTLKPESKRISLSLKALMKNPAEKFLEKYPEGSRIKVKVVKLTSRIAYLQTIENNIPAIMFSDDISWYGKKNPREQFRKGAELEVCILGLSEDGATLKVGLKQLQKDPWELVDGIIKEGKGIKGKVKSIRDFGIFIEIRKGVEGLAPLRELLLKKGEKPHDVYNVGQEVEALVLQFNPKKRKLILSPKQWSKKEELEVLEKYTAKDEGIRLGEILNSQLRNKEKNKKK